jgi:hypothetical protein
MFHVELRHFPHVARAFNLGREELDARILIPWVAGTAIEMDDRRWAPERAKLAIYEGRALASDELGMGRGWSNAGRSGERVTERLLAETEQRMKTPPALVELKQELLARCGRAGLGLREVVALAESEERALRASESLALAEQAVWELLLAGQLRLLRDGAPLGNEEWQPALLNWGSWVGEGPAAISVEAL